MLDRRLLVVTFLLAIEVSCAGSSRRQELAEPGDQPPAHRGHDDHGGPLVHRFQSADAWAPVFDDPKRDAWQRPTEVLTLMAVGAGQIVADVGAGTGYFEPYLSRAVGSAGRVLAVDIEPDMVRYLAERAAREGLANVDAILGAVDDPRLPAGKVDRVLIVDTWHHIPERGAYARKLKAALRADGGSLTIVEFTLETERGPKRAHRLAPEALLAELASAGFRAEMVAESLPDQYVVVAH